MNDKPKMEIKKPTVNDLIKDWGNALRKKGLTPSWPSWAYGTYIREDSMEAQANKKRLGERKFPDVKTKVVRRWNKNITIEYDKTKAYGHKIVRRNGKNVRVDGQHNPAYFAEDNALNAIATMLLSGVGRRGRRSLARSLGLKWKTEYLEAEKMIMESKNFSGFGFDNIKLNFGV